MSAPASRRITAAALVVAFVLAAPVARAQALGAGLSGRVFAADGLTPRPGATVHLVRGEGEQVFSSAPTPADGSFAIDGAAAGSYALVVETAGGSFLSAQPIVLGAGANPPLGLALAPALAADTGLGAGSAQPMRPWLKWLIVGLIGVTGLYVIHEVTDSEESASDFE